MSSKKGGAPRGNDNERNGKRWKSALMRALARKSNKDVNAGLDLLADKVVNAAIDNLDPWCVKEIANRIDGRPVQALEHAGEGGGPIQFDRPMSDREAAQLVWSMMTSAAEASSEDGDDSARPENTH